MNEHSSEVMIILLSMSDCLKILGLGYPRVII